jgi:hypothetical protein
MVGDGDGGWWMVMAMVDGEYFNHHEFMVQTSS